MPTVFDAACTPAAETTEDDQMLGGFDPSGTRHLQRPRAQLSTLHAIALHPQPTPT